MSLTLVVGPAHQPSPPHFGSPSFLQQQGWTGVSCLGHAHSAAQLGSLHMEGKAAAGSDFASRTRTMVSDIYLFAMFSGQRPVCHSG